MKREREPIRIRILTLNIHKGLSHFSRKLVLSKLRDAIRDVSADLVFLQEVIGEHRHLAQRHARNWPTEAHYEFLAQSIWHSYAYGRNAFYPNGHHGNALLSKFPISCHQNIDVSVGNTERRGFLHCEIDQPEGGVLHAICVHLGLREGHRQKQLALLCQLVEKIPMNDPVVVAGDFNDWRGKSTALMYDCGLTDVFAEEFGASPKTFPAIFPMLRLDRIYVRGVHSFSPVTLPGRPWAHLSDHAPLASEIEL